MMSECMCLPVTLGKTCAHFMLKSDRLLGGNIREFRVVFEGTLVQIRLLCDDKHDLLSEESAENHKTPAQNILSWAGSQVIRREGATAANSNRCRLSVWQSRPRDEGDSIPASVSFAPMPMRHGTVLTIRLV